MIKTVQDLINELELVENKNLPIFGYFEDCNRNTNNYMELVNLEELNSRVDINLFK